ncbi:MAG TPA: carboxypeptidase regulatory-like domain-containing protein, partial [Bryobacteraceae bacterium]|nr:carboxypeptidase regulatory-like domain-containing protein [Bryobacteraceae bacterium]
MAGKWLIILYTALLCAQAQNDGRIAGRRVSDSGGLPVAHASVTLRNTLTGAGKRQETSGAGEYSFSGLPEGRYSLAVSGPGLESGTKPIEIGRQTVPQVVDVRLEPSHIKQQVTVVSGSRIEELQNQSALRVEAVTREQIRDTGYERVSDVLSEIPG